ncbi:MAG: hypothetical protein ACTTH6_02835 [Candidatus Altimarinota bacterium]
MIKTSQFIGLKLKVEYFANIFIEIKDLLGDKEKEILEFQNPLSLHITVYYLPGKTTEIENKKIKDLIDNISQQKIKISMKKLEYFGDNIAYISYDDFENLEKINNLLKSKFIDYNSIVDNSYNSFVPHTTLFKIKDYGKFLLYKNDIENIVVKNIEKMQNYDYIENFHLYAVNSTFTPELQVIIY